MSQPLYVFDMDDTLVDGDCSMLWNGFLVEKGIVSDPTFLETDRAMMALYAKGEMDMEDYLAFTLAPLAIIPAVEIDALVDEFVALKVLPNIFPEALALIRSLREENTPLLIISATVTFIVKKVAQSIGIDQAIGIDLSMNNDCYSNQVAGIPSYREGKIQRLKNWVETNQTSFDAIHFYTDSINDLPLCLYADHIYLINPCSQLRDKALQYDDWQIYSWGREAAV